MPKYKHLRSIAHNLAHSYFSLMNYVDEDYIFEHLFKIVKDKNIQDFVIDVIEKKVEPHDFMTTTIRKSLIGLNKHAQSLLKPHHMDYSDIISFKFYVKYDFENTMDEIHHVYELKSIIIDKNEKTHCANVVEWWKY